MLAEAREVIAAEPDAKWVPFTAAVVDFVLRQWRPNSAVTLFISAPQGAGKTSFATLFERVCARLHFRCVSLSIDDFYWPALIQRQLADRRGRKNELLCQRGMPGTHDVALAVETLKKLRGRGGATALTRYDKGAAGCGDRVSGGVVSLPVDFVLFDGWCVGFEPTDADGELSEDMREINSNLRNMQALRDCADAWVVLGVNGALDLIFDWREEQEAARTLSGLARTMDEAEVRKFVEHFMPGYEAYQGKLENAARQGRIQGKPTLYIELDRSRQPQLEITH